MRSPDDIVGEQQILWRSTACLRSISHSPVLVLNAKCNNPVREGVVSIVKGHHGSTAGRGRCLFSKASGPALENAQPPTQYVPRLGDRGMKLFPRFYLVPRLSTAITPLPHIPSWRALGQIYALGIFLALCFRVCVLLKSPNQNPFNVSGKQF